jgi:hypothetical protein
MTSVTGGPMGHHLPNMRRAPRPGDIGHPGTCPLCADGNGTPPCLACRDELRARLTEFNMVNAVQKALN